MYDAIYAFHTERGIYHELTISMVGISLYIMRSVRKVQDQRINSNESSNMRSSDAELKNTSNVRRENNRVVLLYTMRASCRYCHFCPLLAADTKSYRRLDAM
jgi:hypothetical protein